MTSFTAEAWAANLSLFERARDMPFNRELGDGTLHPDSFRHYVVQDAHYLVAFGQALAVAAAKADHPDHIVQFAAAAQGAIAVERELHTDLIRKLGLEPHIFADTPVAPTCDHYRAFLLATAFREPLPVVVAAMLPCFWIYREVGRHILGTARVGNPFQAWIDTYGGDEFAQVVDRMIAVTDELAEETGPPTRLAMHRAYARACQLEWMFWDAAHRREVWPV